MAAAPPSAVRRLPAFFRLTSLAAFVGLLGCSNPAGPAPPPPTPGAPTIQCPSDVVADCFELARAAREKFGGDALGDFVGAWRAYLDRIPWQRTR